ncbi:HET-domain-containing protein [Aspergillus sclerotioniger CBS 115572]|uniref:HET-domain-containing protein n=1 Tax=Aspergillus sclerotioniger CBS 115572 TaxID=1450535 RepID=A0A317VSU2_9EURO|nr:HET-domain-containing protein [Aspergillus sclerotioniger CBS 115572]PWY76097.1 HET-domain-containing protein [Aspergillus sclerotioniger CBS 115572]
MRIPLGNPEEIRGKQSTCDLCKLVIDCAAAHYVPGFRSFNHSEPIVLLIDGGKIEIHYPEHGDVQIAVYLRSEHNSSFEERPGAPQEQHRTPTDVPEYIDWSKVLEWLESTPYMALRGELGNWPDGMKVIDVKQNRVIGAPKDCRYFALSYVWGNVKALDLPDWPAFSREDLPATIRDAFVVCERLGVPYLWVDQLCIRQGDPKDVKVQIDQMGRIYNHAACALVALAGSDLYYGLPGVTKPRRWTHVELGQAKLTILSLPPDNCIRRNIWNSRGWTFQEALLARQLLLFAEYEVYHASSCDGRRWYNCEIYRSVHRGHKMNPLPLPSDYLFALEEYTTRRLTMETDRVRACTTVLQAAHGGELYHGIPVERIDEAVLWTTVSPGLKAGSTDFPSWSWASPRGPIQYEFKAMVGLAVWAIPKDHPHASVVLCRPRRGTSLSLTTPPPRGNLGSPEIPPGGCLGHIIKAWLQGCIEERFPVQSVNHEALANCWTTYADFWESAFGGGDYGTLFPVTAIQTALSVPSSILVYGAAAQFSVKQQTTECTSSTPSFALFTAGPEGRLAGTVYLDAQEMDGSVQADLEFLALSVAYGNHIMAEQCQQCCDDTVWDTARKMMTGMNVTANDRAWNTALEETTVLNVMAIRREQCRPSLARRLGVGQIALQRWVEARPQFGTIVLR